MLGTPPHSAVDWDKVNTVARSIIEIAGALAAIAVAGKELFVFLRERENTRKAMMAVSSEPQDE